MLPCHRVHGAAATGWALPPWWAPLPQHWAALSPVPGVLLGGAHARAPQTPMLTSPSLPHPHPSPHPGIPAGALPAARSAGSCGGSQDGGLGSRWHRGETAAGTLLPIPVKPRALGHIVQCQGANTRFGVSGGAR